MKNFGITVYPDFYSLDEIRNYITKAKQNGFSRIFTCMQLGDFGFDGGLHSTSPLFKEMFSLCHELNIEVSADTNDVVFAAYGATCSDLKPFKDLGIDILRIDGGFSFEEIITMTNNEYGLKVEVNASFIISTNKKLYSEGQQLLENIKKKGNVENFLACFNFYPRIETGQSIEMVKDSINIFKAYNISLGAFVASQYSKHDLFELGHGVMTLEHQRYMKPWIASQELFALGIDTILIGDTMAADIELEQMHSIINNEYIEIPVVLNEYIDNELKKKILQTEFIVREDQAETVIRSQSIRKAKVEPRYCVSRKKYAITIDNKNNFRYEGEVQICLKEMDRNIGVNVIGFIHDEGIHLLEYLKHGNHNFKFIEFNAK